MKNKNIKGFTLIELLIVISILAILMAGAYLALNPKEKQDKARAARIANDLRQIQKAFELTAVELGRDTYPTESDLGLGSNPSIKKLVDNNKLNHISAKIKAEGLGDEKIEYDNDGDEYPYLNNCPGNTNGDGANLIVWGISDADNNKIVLELDKIFDKSDGLKCGRIRTYSSGVIYNLDDNK